MPFVKLDCGILNSTLWFEREAREIFLTSLLMAEPREFTEAIPQINVRNLDYSGWEAPPGWYGFVPAAGVGIIDRAKVDKDAGLDALELLGKPEDSSRSQDFQGRRMIRVDGGYLILNYMKYRERDYTSAERSRRYRDRKAAQASHRVVPPSHRDITQAEEEVEAEEYKPIDQDHRADARKSHKVLVKLAHQAITEAESESEGIERTKELAARAHIPYNTGAVIRAYESALKQKAKAS